ncbi:uncharacterized protein [Argopecten irradians]|uniref:uncharacterized protein n=1 Tax=Argopecten irradians TaxID=31199 RepID=UPI0037138FAE
MESDQQTQDEDNDSSIGITDGQDAAESESESEANGAAESTVPARRSNRNRKPPTWQRTGEFVMSQKNGSDFDQNDDWSDHSFSSDTDMEEKERNTESTLGNLGSQASEIDGGFWSDTLCDVDIGSFEEVTGPIHNIEPGSSILHYFFLMLSEAFFPNIIRADLSVRSPERTRRRWYDAKMIFKEYLYLSLKTFSSVFDVQYDFFSAGNQGVKDTMTCGRHSKLSQYFHVNDNTTQVQPVTPQYDSSHRLHKVRPMLEHLWGNFRSCMKQQKHLAIDEGMVHTRATLCETVYASKTCQGGLKVKPLSYHCI